VDGTKPMNPLSLLRLSKRFIVSVLFEAVLLSVIGGLIGLLLIFLLTLAASTLLDFDIALSLNNILTGIIISSVIGLISGIAPALTASRLDPVEEIRAK